MKREIKVLLIFIILVPLGLLAGEAWGEWEKEELAKLLGYVPSGLEKFSGLWKAPFQDYTMFKLPAFPSYILSAAFGVALIFILFALLKKK